MKVSVRLRNSALLGIAAALLVAMWCYYDEWHAYNYTQLYLRGFTRPAMSDIYPRWLGARELLVHHRNPYSAEITREIQTGIYGRPLQPGRPGEPIDEQRFAYPLYVVFLLAPFVFTSFHTFELILRPLLVLAGIGTVLLWRRRLRLSGGRTGTGGAPPFAEQTVGVVLIVTLTLATLPFVEALQLNQLAIITGLLIAAAIWALGDNRYRLAGAFLAVATIKPQLVLPVIVCLAIWTLGDWRQRRRMLAGLAITMVFLAGASAVLLPNWMAEFIAGARAYNQYKQSMSLLQAATGRVLGNVLNLAVAAWLAFTAWRMRSAPADSTRFHALIACVLAYTAAVVPSLSAYNQVLLVPLALLMIGERARLWQAGAGARALVRGTVIVVAWQWIAAVMLAWVSPERASRWIIAPFLTNPLVPVMALCCALLLLTKLQAEHASATADATKKAQHDESRSDEEVLGEARQ